MGTNAMAYAVINTVFGLYKNDEALVEALNLNVIEAYEKEEVFISGYIFTINMTLGRDNKYTIAAIRDGAGKVILASVVPDTLSIEAYAGKDDEGVLEDYLEVGDSYPCILRDSSDGTVSSLKPIYVRNTMAILLSIGNKTYLLSPNYVFETDTVRSKIGGLRTLVHGNATANIIKKTSVEDFILAYEKDKVTVEKANKLHKIAKAYLETIKKYKGCGQSVLDAACKKLDAVYTSIPVCEKIKLNMANPDISTWSREQIVSFFNSIGYTQSRPDWITNQMRSKLTTGDAVALKNGDKLETYICNAVIKHMSGRALMPAGIGSTVVIYKDAQNIVRYCWSLGKVPFKDLTNYLKEAIEYNKNASEKDKFAFIVDKTGKVTLGHMIKSQLGISETDSYEAFTMYRAIDIELDSGTARTYKATLVIKDNNGSCTCIGYNQRFCIATDTFTMAYEDLKKAQWSEKSDAMFSDEQFVIAHAILEYRIRKRLGAADLYKGIPFGDVLVNIDGNFVGYSGLTKASSEAAYLDTTSQHDTHSVAKKRLIQCALAQGCNLFKTLTKLLMVAYVEGLVKKSDIPVAREYEGEIGVGFEYAFGLGIPTFYAEVNGISTEAPTSIPLNCEDLYTAKDLQVQSATTAVNNSNGIYDDLDDEEELEGYLDEDDELEDDDFGSDDFDTLDDIDEQVDTSDDGFDSFDSLDEDMDELDGEKVYSEDVADDENDEAHITVTTEDGAAILNWKEVLRLNFQLRDATDLRLTEIWTTMLTSAKQNDISEKELLSMLYTRFTGEEAD